MFGRSANQDQKPHEQPLPSTSHATPPQPPSPPAFPLPSQQQQPAGNQQSPTSTSIIGDDLAIVGQKITIVSQSRVHINGNIQGDINGKEVVVGRSGKVTGVVTAHSVSVEGEVDGAIRGSSVTLTSTARVEGDIHHRTLSIAEGAHFDGRVRRPKDDAELSPNLDVASLTAASTSN
ncbi:MULTISPECIES: polymer-forming cytoskeletal protein [Filomicrobium]|uniref:Protein CcmA, bactofilin family n=1 Tax=Filomicrobium insigne TaxID=418854 RepID=A0A1H0LJZ9_9HYPH|nr:MULTISPECIES: polymer-forming cytoskeletal protein [Filomicrobium]MCV0368658.1 polymer-forming cytoskeletal protein [Filomicrobium sp.]SDO68504.1 protein CcmA, bactofilin family [Filomicrobium insigne]